MVKTMEKLTFNGKMIGKEYVFITKSQLSPIIRNLIGIIVVILGFGYIWEVYPESGSIAVESGVFLLIIVQPALMGLFTYNTVYTILSLFCDGNKTFKRYVILQDSVSDFGNVQHLIQFKDGETRWVNA